MNLLLGQRLSNIHTTRHCTHRTQSRLGPPHLITPWYWQPLHCHFCRLLCSRQHARLSSNHPTTFASGIVRRSMTKHKLISSVIAFRLRRPSFDSAWKWKARFFLLPRLYMLGTTRPEINHETTGCSTDIHDWRRRTKENVGTLHTDLHSRSRIMFERPFLRDSATYHPSSPTFSTQVSCLSMTNCHLSQRRGFNETLVWMSQSSSLHPAAAGLKPAFPSPTLFNCNAWSIRSTPRLANPTESSQGHRWFFVSIPTDTVILHTTQLTHYTRHLFRTRDCTAVSMPCLGISCSHPSHIFSPTALLTSPAFAIAVSTPLNLLTTACTPIGSTPSTCTYREYTGTATSPLSPLSTNFSISFATSAGLTTGPQKLLGVVRFSNILVPIWPGVTSIVFMSAASGFWASSARREECRASSAALEALYEERFAAPRWPRTEETVTMVPRRAESMCGRMDRRVLKCDSVFVRKVCETSSAVEERSGFVWTMPALLIRMVGGPSCSQLVSMGIQYGAFGVRGNVHLQQSQQPPRQPPLRRQHRTCNT
jgi:hypothetical protein